MSEVQPPESPAPRCSRMAVGVLLLGLFSGPIWLLACFPAVLLLKSYKVVNVAAATLALVVGCIGLVSWIVWARIVSAKEKTCGRRFAVAGLAAALLWGAVIGFFLWGLRGEW